MRFPIKIFLLFFSHNSKAILMKICLAILTSFLIHTQVMAYDVNISNTQNNCMYPSIATTAAGVSYVVWQENVSGNWEIFLCRVNNSGTVDPGFGVINVSSTTAASSYPDIAVDISDRCYIVWQESQNINFSIIDGSGVKVVDRKVIDSGSCSNPCISTTPEGTSNIVYEKTVITSFRVYYSQVNNSGTTLVDRRVVANLDIIGIVPKYPYIITGTDGNSYIFWRDFYNWVYGIYYCPVSPNGTLGSASRFLTDENATKPKMGLSTDNGYICLEYDEGSTQGIYTYYNQLIQIDQSSSDATNPTIASDENDNCYLAWQDMRNGNADIYLAKLALDGHLGGGEIKITDSTSSSQEPDISAVNGTWYLVWQNNIEGLNQIHFTKKDLQPLKLTEFTFSPISSPQSLSIPFLVTLKVVDQNGIVMTGYNGAVSISSTIGSITPTEVILENGQKSFDVRIHNQGEAQLIAYADGVFGYSNKITIQDSSNCRSSITGKVLNVFLERLLNAEVQLWTNEITPVMIGSVTATDGTFLFHDISCGSYEIRVRYYDPVNGNEINKQGIQVKVSGTLPIAIPSILMPWTPTQITPVVLVPGFIGSSTGWSLYPILSQDILDPNLNIHDPLRIVGFRDLKEQLANNGFMVIECPWDWRLKMQDAYRVFLMPKLAEAKTYSSTGKVHVIAHSMGGLLVRQYIQSGDYESDIDKLAMVGTPNLGSCNPYYVWEGGEPKLVDDITDSGFFQMVNPYSETIKRLWTDTYNKKKDWDEVTDSDIRSFVRRYAPSLKQLMSTEDFLSTNTGSAGTSGDNENEWLKELNNDSAGISRMSSNGANGTAQVGLYVGDIASSTIETITVGDPDTLYRDGVPSPSWWRRLSAHMGNGDGTVPKDSASYPNNQGWASQPYTSTETEHKGLIKHFTKNNYLLNFLSGNQLAPSSILPRANAVAPTSGLNVSLSGTMRCYITNPSGQHVGINPSNGYLVEEISGTEVVFDVNGGSLNIPDPVNGTYTVTIFGEEQRDYGVEVGYMDATRSDTLRYRGFVPIQPLSFTITVNAAVVPRITITPPVPAPGSLRSESYTSGTSKLTRLKWNSVSDIVGYNVYSAGETDPFYALLTTVPLGTTYLDTADAWSTSDVTPVKTYAVSAVRADGTVSFFSNETQNKPSRCECDLNNDGKCNMQDWLLFGQRWGATDCITVFCACDLNADGRCNMSDWLLFGKNWGRTDCPIP